MPQSGASSTVPFIKGASKKVGMRKGVSCAMGTGATDRLSGQWQLVPAWQWGSGVGFGGSGGGEGLWFEEEKVKVE